MTRQAAAAVGADQSRGPELGRDFFSQPTAEVARGLIGARLLVDGAVDVEIVETEAYLGEDDAASHAWRGPRGRAAIMFGEPGHLYVYRSYGIHWCANLVTEAPGIAGAVLLRGGDVLGGVEIACERRPGIAPDMTLRGPGNFCRGLAISGVDNGADICAMGSRFAVYGGAPREVATSTRIGITRNADAQLRFYAPRARGVSGPPRAPSGKKEEAP